MTLFSDIGTEGNQSKRALYFKFIMSNLFLITHAIGHLDDMDFEFAGGKDKPFIPKNSGLFITSIKLGSILEEKVSIGDKIITVNNVKILL